MEFNLKDSIDVAHWETLLGTFSHADVYHRAEYVVACSEIELSEALGLEFSVSGQRFLLPILIRKFSGPDGRTWEDGTSPYGYGGILSESLKVTPEIGSELLRQVQQWAIDRRLVSCVLRSHPLLQQGWLTDFTRELDFAIKTRSGPTVAIDLQDWDGARRRPTHIHRRSRSYLEASRRKLQVTWSDSEPAEYFRIFQNLYSITMSRLEADAFFLFPTTYYDRLAKLKEEVSVAVAWLGNRPVGAAVFMFGRSFAHYHLSAADESGREHRAATLLVVAGAERGREHGCHLFHLGGGIHPSDSLFRFKSSFGGLEYQYSTVMLVQDMARYKLMCAMENPQWPYLNDTRSDGSPSLIVSSDATRQVESST